MFELKSDFLGANTAFWSEPSENIKDSVRHSLKIVKSALLKFLPA
jgi:hypothetical protein